MKSNEFIESHDYLFPMQWRKLSNFQDYLKGWQKSIKIYLTISKFPNYILINKNELHYKPSNFKWLFNKSRPKAYYGIWKNQIVKNSMMKLIYNNSNGKVVLTIKINHVELFLRNVKTEIKNKSNTLFFKKMLLFPAQQDAP